MIGVDKLYHFGISLLATLVLGWKFAAGLGLGKEVGDKLNPLSKWDWQDLLADALGILVGLIIRHLIAKVM